MKNTESSSIRVGGLYDREHFKNFREYLKGIYKYKIFRFTNYFLRRLSSSYDSI